MSIFMKDFYFPVKFLNEDLWQMSNGEKSLILACCITNNKILDRY